MEGRLSVRDLSSMLIRIVLSLACAGITYFVWMGLFILMADSVGSLVRGMLWFAAPVVTAMGFATGILLHEHATGRGNSREGSLLNNCVVRGERIWSRGGMGSSLTLG
jgi:hypothetical protein